MEPSTTAPSTGMAPVLDNKPAFDTTTTEITTTPDHSSSTPGSNAAHALRLQCRNNTFLSPTSGIASGHIQANLLALPSSAAPSFFALCQRNPAPCPLLAYSKPGSPKEFISCLPGLSGDEMCGDFDVRTDAPAYCLYESGKNVGEVADVKYYFKEDHIAFLIGCSFSFESRLAACGLPPKHWLGEKSGNCPMYKTNIPLLPAGVFSTPGTMVVSMRPYLEKDIERVRSITGEFGSMHGEPVAWGWEAMERIGIRNIYDVDFGEPTEVRFGEGEVPVFWGCGVTPQIAVMGAGSAIEGLVIGHKPGHMLVLDLTEEMALEAEKRMVGA